MRMALFFGIARMSLLFYFPGGTQQAAGRIDVLSTTGANRCEHAVCREIVAQGFHFLLVGPVKGHAGYLVEADEIDTTLQSVEQPDNFPCVCHGVVHASKDNVLERQTALSRKVVLVQQVDDVGDAHSPFGRH